VKTEIKYGRIPMDNELVGYVTWNEGNDKVELLSPPYHDLIKVMNGKIVGASEEDVMIWTKVAGWLGVEELSKRK
jgi:hypothetical protein